MYTLTFTFVDNPRSNNSMVTRRGDSFQITFSGNRIYRYAGVDPSHVLGRVIKTNTSELKGFYVVLKGHTLFSLSNTDSELIQQLKDNPELVATVDSLETFQQYIDL